MSTVYGIADNDGYPITDGISTEDEARRIAQRLANERGESVELIERNQYADDVWPDGEIIEPDDGKYLHLSVDSADGEVLDVLGRWTPGAAETAQMIRDETVAGCVVVATDDDSLAVGDYVDVDDEGCASRRGEPETPPVITTYTAVITGRGSESQVPDREDAVDADIIIDGEVIGAVTLLHDRDGDLAPWGNIDHWASADLVERLLALDHDGILTKRDEAVSAIVDAVRDAAAQEAQS